jgi:hypothetical protein
VTSYVDAGVSAGAKLVVDGCGLAVDGGADGFWLGPTLFDNVGGNGLERVRPWACANGHRPHL